MNFKTVEEAVKYYEDRIQAVNDYFNAGMTQKKAAEKNGISRPSLQRFLDKLGIVKVVEFGGIMRKDENGR